MLLGVEERISKSSITRAQKCLVFNKSANLNVFCFNFIKNV